MSQEIKQLEESDVQGRNFKQVLPSQAASD